MQRINTFQLISHRIINRYITVVYYYEIINRFNTVRWSSIFAKVKKIKVSKAHGSVVIGVKPLTQISLVQTSLWSLMVCAVYLDKALYLHCFSLPSWKGVPVYAGSKPVIDLYPIQEDSITHPLRTTKSGNKLSLMRLYGSEKDFKVSEISRLVLYLEPRTIKRPTFSI